jgi:hypothetical protein
MLMTHSTRCNFATTSSFCIYYTITYRKAVFQQTARFFLVTVLTSNVEGFSFRYEHTLQHVNDASY